MVSEFEELEHLVHQEAGASLEQATAPNRPAEVSEATPAQQMQQGCDGEHLHLDLRQAVLPPTPLSRCVLEQLVVVGGSLQPWTQGREMTFS